MFKSLSFLAVALFALSSAAKVEIFYEGHDAKNNFWNWKMEGTAQYKFEKSTLELKVPNQSGATAYNDSSIFTKQMFHPAEGPMGIRFKTSVKNISMNIGSRGWGFWNTNPDPQLSEMAWFLYSSKANTPRSESFYVITKRAGEAPQKTFLDANLLNDSNNEQPSKYEVEWQAGVVIYKVNGNEVARHTNSPQGQMRLHIWVDNAKWTFWPETGIEFVPMGPLDSSFKLYETTVERDGFM